MEGPARHSPVHPLHCQQGPSGSLSDFFDLEKNSWPEELMHFTSFLVESFVEVDMLFQMSKFVFSLNTAMFQQELNLEAPPFELAFDQEALRSWVIISSGARVLGSAGFACCVSLVKIA